MPWDSSWETLDALGLLRRRVSPIAAVIVLTTDLAQEDRG